MALTRLLNHRRPWLGALACGLAIWLLGSMSAEASCGDWLADHPPQPQSALLHPTDFAATGRLTEEPASAPCSCRGPECRRSPLDLPAVPLREITFAEREVAAFAGPVVDQFAADSAFARPENQRQPGGAALSAPMRPPRALSLILRMS
jgi:hypothetical protein